jgi:hydrogenase expression/formation protein HypC
MCLGVPGKVDEIYKANGLKMGKVDFGGVKREVCLEYVPEVEIGEYVIVHVGFAINQMSEEEAEETLDLLRQIIDIGEEIGPEGGAA